MFTGKKDARIAVLIGTRPGIIKMAPLTKELERRGGEYFVIHTGQHYSAEMDKAIIDDVGIGEIRFQIQRPPECVTHGQQTAYMLNSIEMALLEAEPDVLLVCGDANTNLAGALAARKLHVAVGHVESGLRSFDWRMPEEHNRVMIDHISDLLFAPTSQSRAYLERESVRGRVFVVGNTIVDATLEYGFCESRIKGMRSRFLLPDRYTVVTSHREENVDNALVLKSILTALWRIAVEYHERFVFPIHPRTKKMIERFGYSGLLARIPGLVLLDPIGYRDFLALVAGADFVMTDSGGLQEESCILRKPCLTLRESTERPETVSVGANRVVGTDADRVVEGYVGMKTVSVEGCSWRNPYGDGKAARRIIEICYHGQPEDEFSGVD